MRRLPAALLLLGALLAVPPAGADHVTCVAVSGALPSPAPQCHDRVVPPGATNLGTNLPNTLGGVNTTVRVLLPTDYNTNLTATYPVLYLLHGAGDTYKTWTQNTDLIHFAQNLAEPLNPMTPPRRVIIVMPDGGCQFDPNKSWCNEAGWYSDWIDGSRKYETFHIDVLVPWVEANYRTMGAGHRATAGLSMGGFGAMKYAALHPGMFQAAASFSGLLDTWYGAPLTGLLYDDFSGTISDDVWGDQLSGALTWQANNPAFLAGQPPFPLNEEALFLTSGTGEVTRDKSPPFDIGENLIFQTNMSFVRALLTAGRVPGIHYKEHYYAGGRHSWEYWQAALHWALPQIVDVID